MRLAIPAVRSRRRALRFGALLLVLCAALFAVTRPLGQDGEGLSLTGEEMLREEAARRGLSERQEAPGLGAAGTIEGLTDPTGATVDLARYAGRPTWIVFWATYCHACRNEEPEIRRMFERYADSALIVLAINIGEEPQTVRRYVEDRALPWTVWIDRDGDAVHQYAVLGTPTHYFIDRDGLIRSRAFGRMGYSEMEEHVRSLLDEPSR